MIEVAVIGAGSAGIVAARHLISAGLRPTIFEVAKTIGGAWTPSPAFSERTNDKSEYAARKMWYGLHTNLSKYTCQFTDWPWPEDTATFPSVDEMHRYLQSYSDNFLDSESCDFQFECEVMNVDRLQTIDTSGNLALSDGQACYSVEWLDLKTKIRANKEFNGVVVATGFFNTPKFPSFLKDYSKRNSQEKRPEVIHSSDYHIHSEFENKNVAVIGASFSALEIAADLSQSASRVINVVSSVPWVLPRWLSKIEPLQMTESTPSEDAPHRDTITILPVDLAFYQRNDPFPQEEVVHLDEESCQERHKFLRSLAGHKQKHSPLGEPVHWNEPPFIAISDEYLDLIREGKIEVVKGRLEGINDDGSLSLSDSRTIQDIDAVICCTGYTPHLQSILSSTILETLEYDHEDTFGPLSLAWDVMHPSLPGLAFCGMVSLTFNTSYNIQYHTLRETLTFLLQYRGPYMGVMDLQARLLAGTMSGKLCPDKEKLQSALETNRLIRTANPRAQFPRFDYIGRKMCSLRLIYLQHISITNVSSEIYNQRVHGYTCYALLQWRAPDNQHKNRRHGRPTFVSAQQRHVARHILRFTRRATKGTRRKSNAKVNITIHTWQLDIR